MRPHDIRQIALANKKGIEEALGLDKDSEKGEVLSDLNDRIDS